MSEYKMDFPSNSHKSKAAVLPVNGKYPKNAPEEPKDAHRAKPVAKAVKKKASPGRQLIETFITDDLANVKDYILFDVAVPAIKNAIVDMVTDGISMLLLGDTSNRRSIKNNTPKVSYSSYYSNKKETRDYLSRDRYSYSDLVFRSRGEAEDVLGQLIDILDAYNVVSVADFYEAAGVSSNFTDNKYGWESLNGARVDRNSQGYFLRLPRAKVIS